MVSVRDEDAGGGLEVKGVRGRGVHNYYYTLKVENTHA